MKVFSKIIRTFVGFMLLINVLIRNDLSLTMKQDPMELWLALGIACLLLVPAPSQSSQ